MINIVGFVLIAALQAHGLAIAKVIWIDSGAALLLSFGLLLQFKSSHSNRSVPDETSESTYPTHAGGMFTHELDAMTQSEWRLIYVLRSFSDEQGRWWLVHQHMQLVLQIFGRSLSPIRALPNTD
jgi:hypothetical protein